VDKTTQDITVKLRDRVTFDTDEGIQAGYVNDLRRDLGNGELHAWVEVDHQLPGGFRAVPVSDILTSDQVGPPSTFYIGIDCATGTADGDHRFTLVIRTPVTTKDREKV
jgi:hypothetical protein